MSKKLKYLFLAAMIVVCQSCGKHGEPNPDDDANLVLDEAVAVELPEVSIPLVKTLTSQRTLTALNGDEFNWRIVERFEYDSKNRITLYDFNNGNYVYEYTYDVGNRVIGVVEKASQEIHYKYTYYKDRIVVTSERDGYTIFLDSKKRVDKVVPYGSLSSFGYVYDDRGNMMAKSNVLSDERPPFGTHTFDTQKNPFTRVAGYNLHFSYLVGISLMREAKGNPNNSTFADKTTGTSIGIKTYIYNADGYPLSSKTVYPSGGADDYELYEYTR